MAVKIKILAVSLNVLDPDQKLLFDHANKRSNVSAYLKRLIQRDMEGVQVVRQFQPQSEPDTDLDDGLMAGLI